MKITKEDLQISELRKKIEAQKKELVRPNTKYITTAILDSPEGRINLNVLTLETILLPLSKMLMKKEFLEKAAALLKIDKPETLIRGFSIEDWISDFKTRAEYLEYAKKKYKLENDENVLRELLSDGAKKKSLLDKISKDY